MCPHTTHHSPAQCYGDRPVAAQIGFKELVLAYRAANGSGPSYTLDMIKPYTPECPPCSMTTKRPPSSHCEGVPPAVAPLNLYWLLSWLHSCGTSSPLTSGQLKPYTSSPSQRELIWHMTKKCNNKTRTFCISCFYNVSFEAICLLDDILRTKVSAK